MRTCSASSISDTLNCPMASAWKVPTKAVQAIAAVMIANSDGRQRKTDAIAIVSSAYRLPSTKNRSGVRSCQDASVALSNITTHVFQNFTPSCPHHSHLPLPPPLQPKWHAHFRRRKINPPFPVCAKSQNPSALISKAIPSWQRTGTSPLPLLLLPC